MLKTLNTSTCEEEYAENLTIIHKNSKGWITLANMKDSKFKQWHYKYQDIFNFIENEDSFFSQCTFYKTFRRLEYLKEINAIYIDVDYYNTDFRLESVLYFVECELYKSKLPIPTLVIDSGRGLYFIWKIKTVPAQALPLFNAVQNNFYEKLKEYGADKKALDATRVLRIVGTTNTKSNTKVKILEYNDVEYDIHFIRDEYLPDIKPKDPSLHKKGRPKKALYLYNEYTLYYARIQDLVKLCELRKWHLQGHREEILFLYRYWTCCFINDTEDALNQVLELNSQFKNPLSEREATKATKSAETCYLSKDKQYKYKNQTLIDLLDISEVEQKSLKSIIGKKEANEREKVSKKLKRRNENGLTPKQQELVELKKRIEALVTQGLTQKEIAEKLVTSKYKVNRLLKN